MRSTRVVILGLAIAVFGLRGLAVAAPPQFAPTITPSTLLVPTVTVTPRIVTTNGTITPPFSVAPSATRTLTTVAIIGTPRITMTAAAPTLTLTATIEPTSTATIARSTIVLTPTPNPLSLDANLLSLDALRARTYGGNGIKIARIVFTGEVYNQVLIEYPSDGLKITGVMNVPRGLGPFPVVILDHGYFKPSEYKTGDGTSRAADAFARRGYLTIAPDYRCYAGSQCGPNPLYVGYAIDVLNLIAQIPSIPDADPARIGIWGHSMGGGITIRALAVTDEIKVASLYGALTGDDEVHYCWLRGCRTSAISTPESRNTQIPQDPEAELLGNFPAPAASSDPMARLREIFAKSSPTRHLEYVNTPMIIHHGESDDTVPIQWSVELADALSTRGKTALLYTYPGEGHVFVGWGWQLFMARTLSFFDEFLNPHPTLMTADQRVLRQERVALESSY